MQTFIGSRMPLSYFKACILAMSLVLFSSDISLAKQSANLPNATELSQMETEFQALHKANDLQQAVEIGEKILSIKTELLGLDHSDRALTSYELGVIYWEQGNASQSILRHDEACKYANARGCLESALVKNEAGVGAYEDIKQDLLRYDVLNQYQLGLENPITLEAMNFVASFLLSKGDWLQASTRFERVHRYSEKAFGPSHPLTATALSNISVSYRRGRRFRWSEKYALRAVEARESAIEPDPKGLASALQELANNYADQWRYDEAEPLYLRALSSIEEAFGAVHPETATALDQVGFAYSEQGDHYSAEPLFLRALSIREETLGPDKLETVKGLNLHADSVFKQGRYDEAETLYRRVLKIRKEHLKVGHIDIAVALSQVASVLAAKDQHSEASVLYKQALQIAEKALDADDVIIAIIRGNFATNYIGLADYNNAESLLFEALEVMERPETLQKERIPYLLMSLARVQYEKGKFDEALPYYKRALAVAKTTLGPNHPLVARVSNDLAMNYFKSGDNVGQAFRFADDAAELMSERLIRDLQGNTRSQVGADRELRNNADIFYNHAIIGRQLADDIKEFSSIRGHDAFKSSQLALQTSTGSALAQAATRFAASDGVLSRLVRDRQDLAREWGALNNRLVKSLSASSEDAHDLTKSVTKRIDAIDEEFATIDARLEADFPDYFILTSPEPLDIDSTQKLLRDDESLVMFVAGTEGTIVFAMTNDRFKWTLVDVNTTVLEEAVRVLRASLENSQTAFPRGQAHGLYKKLMGEVENLVSEKSHVFLVSAGALGSIPLGVLVTEAPEGSDSSPDALRGTSWWGTQQALTTLPSISSLKALRLLESKAEGTEPFAGFGDPVLQGSVPRAGDGKLDNGAQQDRNLQLASRGMAAYFRGRYGDVDAIRTLAPLPNTKTELLALAEALNASPESSLWMDKRATETNLKAADLSEKRVLAFATHGLVSGEMSGLAEPALVLTPPNQATEIDDGLLTASEAALLDLNADWVILSACNTAAADAPGADGLSGLARSFFYAGARSMLVSHWPVRDDAAARLTTQAIITWDANPDIGRAESLRRSMVMLMQDTSDPSLAHPSVWAPFVIVGEGN